MSRTSRKWLHVWMAVCLIFSGMGSLAAHAQETGGAPNASFSDVPDTHWAKKYVARMALKGVVTGYSDGTFRPDRPVSRQEAVLMALRVMGLADEAESFNVSYILNLKSDSYFQKYVSYALYKGLINYTEEINQIGSENAEGWGKAPATREWIAKLTIRAIEEEPLATSVMTFSDQSDISAWALGYVNAAVNLGIVNGKNGRFAPKDSVTRAELATFFSRADKYLAQPANVVTGTVTEISGNSVTIQPAQGVPVRLSVDAGTLVYLHNDNQPQPWASVQRFHKVYAIAFGGVAKYIEVTDNSAQTQTVQGKLVQFDAAAQKILLEVDGAGREFALEPAFTMIDAEGRGLSADRLVPQSTVELVYVAVDGTERATMVRVLRTPVNKTDAAGNIVELNLLSGTIKVQDAGSAQAETYPLDANLAAPDAAVAYGGRTVKMSELRPGDKIQYTVVNDVVTSLKLTEPVAPILIRAVGKVSYYDKQNNILFYKPADGEPTGKYLSSSRVEVVLNGSSGATMDDIETGDEVAMYLDHNDRIVKVEILNRSIVTEYMVSLHEYVPDMKSLITSRNGKLNIYETDGETKFYNAMGAEIPANQLATTLTRGQKLDLTYSTVNNKLISVRVSWQYDGTVISIDYAKRQLVLENEAKDRITFDVPLAAIVEIAGRTTAALSDLKPGDKVRILLNGNQAAAGTVQLKQTLLYKVDSVVNASLRKVKLTGINGTAFEETIPYQTPIRTVNGANVTFAEIAAGKDLYVSYVGRAVTEVVIASVSYGKVTAVDAAAGVFTVKDYNNNGTLKRFAIPQGQPILVNDRVYVITDPQGAITVTVLDVLDRTFFQYDADKRAVTFYKISVNDNNRYTLHPGAVVTRGDSLTTMTAVKNNDQVKAYLYNGLILELEIVRN